MLHDLNADMRIRNMHDDFRHKIKLVGFSLLAVCLSVALIVVLEAQHRGIPLT